MEVFSERTLAVPNSAVILQSMIGIAWLYVLTLYFQDALGYGPLQTGFLFAPMTLASVVAAPVSGRLVTRLGVKPTTVLGLVLVAAGLLLMALMSTEGSILLVLSGMVVGEVGFMLSSISPTIAASGALSEDKRGLAAGVLNTSIRLGNALGLGVVATVVAAASAALGGKQVGPEAMVGGFRWGLMSCVGIVVLALVVVLVGWRGRKTS